MSDDDFAERHLMRGAEYPYDGDRHETDWAHRAARGIIFNLSDRRGIKHELAAVDDDIRIEIVDAIAAIIRAALQQPPQQPEDEG